MNIDKNKLKETILRAALAALAGVLVTKLTQWLTKSNVDEAKEEDTSTLN